MKKISFLVIVFSVFISSNIFAATINTNGFGVTTVHSPQYNTVTGEITPSPDIIGDHFKQQVILADGCHYRDLYADSTQVWFDKVGATIVVNSGNYYDLYIYGSQSNYLITINGLTPTNYRAINGGIAYKCAPNSVITIAGLNITGIWPILWNVDSYNNVIR